MKESKWKILSFIYLIMIMIGLMGCSEEINRNELKNRYTVVCDPSYIPFEFIEEGEYVGFNIDLIKAIADEVGFEIVFETTDQEEIIPGLKSGKFDMSLVGLDITEEQAKKLDYSEPYLKSGIGIAVAVDNEDIKGMKDLEGKVIATRLGSTSAKYISANIDATVTNQYEQLDQAYLSVENGRSEAILYDAPHIAYYIQKKATDKLKVVGGPYAKENYSIAFARDQKQLIKHVNKALETIRESGKYAEIYRKWFGMERQ